MAVLLSVPFLCISQTDIQIPIVMIVNADSTCEINVLWMRYSTLESQFYHDPFVTQFEVLRCLFCVFEMFETFVMCFWCVFLRCLCKAEIGVQLQKLDPQKTLANEKTWQRWIRTHTLFDQAQRAPKQMHDKQHGKAKGTISGQAGVKTTQHNMAAKSWRVILKHHDIVGAKTSKDNGGKDWSAKRIRKQQQVTTLNLTHSQKRFKHAQRTPKQQYEGQHGTEKGAVLRRAKPENHYSKTTTAKPEVIYRTITMAWV